MAPEIDDDYRALRRWLVARRPDVSLPTGCAADKLGFPPAYWRVALADREPLERVVEYLKCFGWKSSSAHSSAGPCSRKPMSKVETRSLKRTRPRRQDPARRAFEQELSRGFVAGFFDAEGHSGDSLRFRSSTSECSNE